MLVSEGVAVSGFEGFSAASGAGGGLQQPQQLFGGVTSGSSLVRFWSILRLLMIGAYDLQTRQVAGHYTRSAKDRGWGARKSCALNHADSASSRILVTLRRLVPRPI